jgi:cation diffusion facilitator CzcD-associated flavoprotein CzcO
VVVFGTGTSAHDICQELHAHGAEVTMVQRSPTMIVNVDPSAQLYDQSYLGEGPPIDIRDILNSGIPLAVIKASHKLITHEVKKLDAALLQRLENVGFRLEFGEDGTGWPLKFRTRGGGYYFNVGCSELIADQKIRLIQATDIKRFTADGLELRDGSTLRAELVVLATGYKGLDHVVASRSAKPSPNAWGRSGASMTKPKSFATCGHVRHSRVYGLPPAHFRNAVSTAATSRCRSTPSKRESLRNSR